MCLLMLCLQVFFSNAVSQPDAPMLGLPLMGQQEQLQILTGFNQTDKPHDTSALVHIRFAQHVASMPDAVAVVFEGISYTYAEVSAD